MNTTKSTDYVQKINKLGKVSRIILTIMRVVAIIGIVATILCGIGIFVVVPAERDGITSKGTMSFEINVDTNKLPEGSIVQIDDIGMDNADDSFSFLGTDFTIKELETDNDGVVHYISEMSFDSHNSTLLKYGGAIACFCAALYLVVMLIIVIFAGKLAKALEICKSPFEESVAKALKHFSFSLIPCFLLFLHNGTIDLTLVLVIIAFIIFSYIFSYGAKLQQESDETL